MYYIKSYLKTSTCRSRVAIRPTLRTLMGPELLSSWPKRLVTFGCEPHKDLTEAGEQGVQNKAGVDFRWDFR